MTTSKKQQKIENYGRFTEESFPDPSYAKTYDGKRPGDDGYMAAMAKKLGFAYVKEEPAQSE